MLQSRTIHKGLPRIQHSSNIQGGGAKDKWARIQAFYICQLLYGHLRSCYVFSSQQMTIKKEKQKVYNLSQILLFKGKRSYHNATIASYDLLTSDPDAQIAIMR